MVYMVVGNIYFYFTWQVRPFLMYIFVFCGRYSISSTGLALVVQLDRIWLLVSPGILHNRWGIRWHLFIFRVIIVIPRILDAPIIPTFVLRKRYNSNYKFIKYYFLFIFFKIPSLSYHFNIPFLIYHLKNTIFHFILPNTIYHRTIFQSQLYHKLYFATSSFKQFSLINHKNFSLIIFSYTFFSRKFYHTLTFIQKFHIQPYHTHHLSFLQTNFQLSRTSFIFPFFPIPLAIYSTHKTKNPYILFINIEKK